MVCDHSWSNVRYWSSTLAVPASTSSQRRVLRSPEWWAVGVSVVALVVAVFSLLHTDSRDNERDRRAAALRMCETYTTGDAMRSLADRIYDKSIPNEDIKSDADRNYDLAKQHNANGIRYLHLLNAWVNVLDVISTGLNNKAYDYGIIKDCFAPSFYVANHRLIGNVFPDDYFPDVRKWSSNMESPSYKP